MDFDIISTDGENIKLIMPFISGETKENKLNFFLSLNYFSLFYFLYSRIKSISFFLYPNLSNELLKLVAKMRIKNNDNLPKSILEKLDLYSNNIIKNTNIN